MKKWTNTDSSLNQILITAFCILIMIITGASDGARGVFLPLFADAFSLSETGSNMIIMMSYIGNMIFLFAGGLLIDRLKKKTFLIIMISVWMSALFCYTVTENYAVLLSCMIFSMGASTMISTSVNIISPLLFISPAFFTNFLGFTQGIGITGVQKIGGQVADKGLSTANSPANLTGWHILNVLLLLLAAAAVLLLVFSRFPEENTASSEKKKYSFLSVLRNPKSILFIVICGLYYTAEHGIQNVLTTYGSEYLGYTVEKSAMFLSLFFGGITLGRLIFAPIVQKIGVMQSMTLFLGTAAVLYISGILLERNGIWLLCLSGLAFSIIWPTNVIMMTGFFTPETSGTAVGFITSAATIFDVLFFAFFGKITESTGYGISIKILPVSMALLCVCFFILRIKNKKIQTN
ncbi:MAG: MFS transporter [Ruminococcus sp.]